MQKIKDWQSYLRSKRDVTANKLTLEQERFLILQRDTRLRSKSIDELVKVHSNMIHKIIKGYRWSNISYEDLYFYGIEGLVSAYDNFDVSKNTKFSTYLFHYVLGRVKRALELYNNTIRKPAMINMTITKLKELEDGQEANEEFLKDISNKKITMQQIKNSLPYLNQKVISIDDITFDILGSFNFDNVIEREYLESMLALLSLREAEILKRKFGVSPYIPHTFKELDVLFSCDTELLFRKCCLKIRKKLGIKDEHT